VGLRSDRIARLATLQRPGGIAHRPLGPTERLGNIVHPLAHPAHHLAEPLAQRILFTGGLAHLAVLAGIALLARLVAALTVAVALLRPLLPLRAEALVEQLLLALHHLLQAAHHLLRFAGAALLHLPGPRGPQVPQHVL